MAQELPVCHLSFPPSEEDYVPLEQTAYVWVLFLKSSFSSCLYLRKVFLSAVEYVLLRYTDSVGGGVGHGYRPQDGQTAQKSIAYFYIPDHLAARGNQ